MLGTWTPLGAGHFLSDSVVHTVHQVILIPSQATISAEITSLVISIPFQAVYVVSTALITLFASILTLVQAVYVFQAAFQLVPSYTINTLLVVS